MLFHERCLHGTWIRRVVCLGGFHPCKREGMHDGCCWVGENQPRSHGQLLIQLDLPGPSCALQPQSPPDGCKSEPSLPGLTFCLPFSVTYQENEWVSELQCPFCSPHPGPRGCVPGPLAHLLSRGQTHIGCLLCSRPCARHSGD